MKRLIIPLIVLILALSAGPGHSALFDTLEGASIDPERPVHYPFAVTPVIHTTVKCITPLRKPFSFISPATIIYAFALSGDTPTLIGAAPQGFLLAPWTEAGPFCPSGPEDGYVKVCFSAYNGSTATAVYWKVIDSYPGCVT